MHPLLPAPDGAGLMREELAQWDFVMLAYGVGLVALAALTIWAWRAMRRAEARPMPRGGVEAKGIDHESQASAPCPCQSSPCWRLSARDFWRRGPCAIRPIISTCPNRWPPRPPTIGQAVRLGGMVQAGSITTEPDGVTVNFLVTGNTEDAVPVRYSGILPDLFVGRIRRCGRGQSGCRRGIPCHQPACQA